MKRASRKLLIFSLVVAWPLVASARYRRSYDAWTHMFFADHYRRGWWELWEPRWYGGFPVVAYPPLIHQLIALVSFPLGVEIAWALVLLSTLVALPFAFRAFARHIVGPRTAQQAAFLIPLLPSVHLTAHTFGQLPTLFGLMALLWGLAALGDFLKSGQWKDGLRGGLWFATAAAAHHGTILVMPWAVAAMALRSLEAREASLAPVLSRLILWAPATLLGIGIVIWPFWQWGIQQTMQHPIDHASRHSFLHDPIAAGLFLWPMYGPMLLALPFLFPHLLRRRRRSIGGLFALCFLMGMGGTTPLPRWVYGAGWEWLTYDRFALWATIWLTPFLGAWSPAAHRRFQRSPLMKRAGVALLAATALYAGQIASLWPTQPPLLDLRPMIAFLNQENVRSWRYVTFGLGDQMARLSIEVQAETIDGNYHTAREWTALRESGLGSLDAAYWLPDGMARLERVMPALGKVGVRWALVNHPAYIPILIRHGWRLHRILANGVEIWENPGALPPPSPAVRPIHPLASLSWGLLPGLTLVGAIGVSSASLKRPGHRPPEWKQGN
ncbi:hypothetical protein HRbin22_02193 [Candidatus Thermoflexus japonica]|uniref:Membrane protein 6-pyruvoyl-tetrahydropterin synthase-related domain-containing protein n=1 Tax=Candidatus Thermoflexus japonica TaxID=2035417 RepID=A0A2H5Y939_9CHLR|nr:hypothetical protein HRbin22_02193 [Candidatus Thermoflexus japonica]